MQIGKSWFLLLMVVAPLCLKAGMFADYLVRYSYYAEVLCENRDNPELECNGKCALMKNLQEAEPDSDPSKPLLPGLAQFKEFPAEPASTLACSMQTSKPHPAFGRPNRTSDRLKGYARIPDHPPAL